MSQVNKISSQARLALYAEGIQYGMVGKVYHFSFERMDDDPSYLLPAFTVGRHTFVVRNETLLLKSEELDYLEQEARTRSYMYQELEIRKRRAGIEEGWDIEEEELSIQDFKRGKTVRHKVSGDSFMVEGNYGDFAIAVRAIRIDNPDEWEIVEDE